MLSKLLHVGPNEHLAELDEITVFLVIDFDDAPRICTSTDLATVIGIHDIVRTNDCKRNLASNFLSLSKSFLIFVLVAGCLEDMNVVVSNVCKYLCARLGDKNTGHRQAIYPGFESNNFLIRQSVGFCDDWNEINPGVQATHEFDIKLLQPVQRRNVSCRSMTKDNKTAHEWPVGWMK